ncbi:MULTISPECIES: type II toxin-antitoxin system RnlB family antitoxin [Bacillus]|uniref:type II toxin-antitoxin system RnlB family antitoxin n=1 Tax=Bacillus TaxID=1386 RepID=UPI0015CF2D80|nr:type II toxin-antitoxin system RnlB family antitoxin [Bacillus cereus]
MKSYEIQKVHNSQAYSYVVYSTSYINPLDEIDYIQQEFGNQFEGKVLFDLLLSNGISPNRFLEVEFDGYQFVDSSFRALENVDVLIRETSGTFYRNRPDYLANSILPNAQQFLITKGKVL